MSVFRLRTPQMPQSSQYSPMIAGGTMFVYGGLVPLGFTHSNEQMTVCNMTGRKPFVQYIMVQLSMQQLLFFLYSYNRV